MKYTLSYEKVILNNGVTLCHRTINSPDIALSVRINQGRLYECAQKAGITHFLEHMLFKSTSNHSSEEIKEILELITGRKIGIGIKAETTQEQVKLFFRFPRENLAILLNILYEILSNDKFREEEVEREREVILKEIGQYEGNPVADFLLRQSQKVFPDHPYGTLPSGVRSTVKQITIDDLVDTKRGGFVGSNIYVSAIGGLEPRSLIQLSNSTLGKLDSGSPSTYTGEIKPITPEEVIEEFENYPFNNLIFFLQVPGFRERNYLYMELIHGYLAEGMNSRLFKALREENSLCYHYEATIADNNIRGSYMINVQNFEIDKHRQIIDLIKNELNAMRTGEIDPKNLERLRNSFRKTFFQEYIEALDNQATIINEIESRKTSYSLLDRIVISGNFSAEDLQKVAQQCFDGRYLIITLMRAR